MKLPISWFLTVAALGTAGYATFHDRVDPPAMERRLVGGQPVASMDRSTRSDVEMLRRELAALKAELATGRAASVVTTQGVQMTSPAAAQLADADPSSQADEERQFRDHIDAIGGQFTWEDRDQRWAGETGIALENVLASGEVKALAVRDIDCRTKTCRVEVEDDGSGAMSGALPFLAMRMADTLPNVVSQRVDEPNGRATVVLYMSRE